MCLTTLGKWGSDFNEFKDHFRKAIDAAYQTSSIHDEV